MIQRYHGDGNIAAEARHAGRAADDDVRMSCRAGFAQLGEGVEEGFHAGAADVGVVDG